MKKKMTDLEMRREIRKMTRHVHCSICGDVINDRDDSCKICKYCLKDQVSQL